MFVDTALLRAGERERMEAVFAGTTRHRAHRGGRLALFLERLDGVTDPEQKRRIIGHTFIEVFEQQAKQGGARFLGQGTLYPDVIESVSFKGPSATIKSHHNVGGLPERMRFELFEPLRDLFKDEVREVGRELGLPPISSIASLSRVRGWRFGSSARLRASGSNCCAAPTRS